MLSKTTKNRFSYKLDKIFWWIVTLFPLFAYLGFSLFYPKDTPISFCQFFITLGIDSWDANPVYKVFNSLFGSNGIFPIFNTTPCFITFFTWCVTVEIIHIIFDVIVFIPRLAHKWISKAVQDD